MAAPRAASLLLALLLIVCFLLGAHAATDCSTALQGLAGCYPYVSNNSTTPDQKTCCTPLNNVLTEPSSFQCLCAQAGSNSGSASSSTFANALLLPKRCNLNITVSQDNCTSSTSNSTSSTSAPSAGVINASPWSYLPAVALFGAFLSIFA